MQFKYKIRLGIFAFCSCLLQVDVASGQLKADSSQVQQVGYNIQGIVKSASTKKGIAGANVSVENISAAITDDEGRFTISIPQSNARLNVSVEGYQAKTLFVKADQKDVQVLMYEVNYNPFYRTVTVDGVNVPQWSTTGAVTSSNVE